MVFSIISVLSFSNNDPKKLKANIYNFKYYSQDDKRWANKKFCGKPNSTISKSGCGVTSMAMILATFYNPKITPINTMNEAYNAGYCGDGINGTDSRYFKYSATRH